MRYAAAAHGLGRYSAFVTGSFLTAMTDVVHVEATHPLSWFFSGFSFG